MLPPLFKTLQASSTVRDLLGNSTNSIRLYRYGEAPQGETAPYATWIVLATPENTLSETPAVDRCGIQVDVWSNTQNLCEEVAIAIRDTVEPVAHMTQYQVFPREEASRKYRISMDFDWFLARE
jgi:hypothetical protein